MSDCTKDANTCNCKECEQLIMDFEEETRDLYRTDIENYQCIDPNCTEYRMPGDTLCPTHFNQMLEDLQKEYRQRIDIRNLATKVDNVIRVDFGKK